MTINHDNTTVLQINIIHTKENVQCSILSIELDCCRSPLLTVAIILFDIKPPIIKNMQMKVSDYISKNITNVIIVLTE